VEKYYRAGQATEDNMAQEHCVLDTQGYKHTVRICNTYCSSTAAVVARKRLIVTLIRKLPVFLVDSGRKGTMKVNIYSFLILFLSFIYSPSVPVGRLDGYSAIRVSDSDIMDTNIETAQSP